MSKGGGFKYFGSLDKHSCRLRNLTSLKVTRWAPRKTKSVTESWIYVIKGNLCPEWPVRWLCWLHLYHSAADVLFQTVWALTRQPQLGRPVVHWCTICFRTKINPSLALAVRNIAPRNCMLLCVCLPPSLMRPKKAPLWVILRLILSKNLTWHNANAFGGVIPPHVFVKLWIMLVFQEVGSLK